MAANTQRRVADKIRRSDAEKKVLKSKLNAALAGLSGHINQRSAGSAIALQQYDGKGKLFEALLMFSVKGELEKRHVRVEVHPAKDNKIFLLRGGPSRLEESRSDAEPSFFRLTGRGRTAFEMHGSVEWPDHHVGGIFAHEVDVSISSERNIQLLREWNHKRIKEICPLVVIEAKFRNRGPDKSLGRELTGLAYGLRANQIFLVSSKRADGSVLEQLAAIKDLENGASTKGEALTYFSPSGASDETIFADIASRIIQLTKLSK